MNLVGTTPKAHLELSEGRTSCNTFAEMVSRNFDGDIIKTRKDLLEYCKLDTFAMVRILENLYKNIGLDPFHCTYRNEIQLLNSNN